MFYFTYCNLRGLLLNSEKHPTFVELFSVFGSQNSRHKTLLTAQRTTHKSICPHLLSSTPPTRWFFHEALASPVVDLCLFCCGRSPLELLNVYSKPGRVERATALPPTFAVAAARTAAHALRDAIISARAKQKRLFRCLLFWLCLLLVGTARHGSEERRRPETTAVCESARERTGGSKPLSW